MPLSDRDIAEVNGSAREGGPNARDRVRMELKADYHARPAAGRRRTHPSHNPTESGGDDPWRSPGSQSLQHHRRPIGRWPVTGTAGAGPPPAARTAISTGVES